MAPRGLSLEEKRVKLLEIFHESKDFYQLKELEKLGPKLKGIVSQSVKEVLQSLVDDGLVQGDKIGSSNFFWSFPSQRGAIMQGRLKQVKDAQTMQQTAEKDLRAQIAVETEARVDGPKRTELLGKLAELKKAHVALLNELGAYGACDPVKVEETRRAGTLAKEAAVRWTDNWSILLSHFVRQHGAETSQIRQHFSVEDEYEDIC
ncbi:meiotic nuclear division protein 1 [Roridomyces roridus]|uniref:Meiotic nuclear division protein 1 n=1 Tax=Roridomyces roridus TaxID=1738132 RepID=A0AAD7CF90_9AGAR|nr:meiotic nuclear division protein 1 [Roridomyces roridus]